MIIEKEEKDVIKSDSLSSIKYSIDADNFPLLFKMLRDNLYQNKEYTIIREYVSNAIDAHIEAGVDKPVEIEWVNASELLGVDTQLIIRDFGTGLSPERVQNIFGKYLSSTKRTDNNSIGGFGIGSKSLFSYTDSYYVKTCYNGIEYHYNCYIDEDDLGSITLMHTEATSKSNGTEIIAPVKQRDKYLFEQGIETQLLFCNITTSNLLVDLDKEIQYEDEDFIFTNRADSLKLLNGKILYDINLYNPQLNDYINFSFLTGIVIKCNIGDVKVTLSREDLDYTKKTIDLLKSKLSVLKDRLVINYKEAIKNCKTFREFNSLYINQISPKLKLHSYSSNYFFEFKDFYDITFNGYRPFVLLEEGNYRQIVNKITASYWETHTKKGNLKSPSYYDSKFDNGTVFYQQDCPLEKDFFEWLGLNTRVVKADVPVITPKPELVGDLVAFCADVMLEIDNLPLLSSKREEFLEYKKEQRKLNRVAPTVRISGEYPVSTIYRGDKGNWLFSRSTIKLKDQDFYIPTIIGNQEDSEKLTELYEIFQTFNIKSNFYRIARNNNKEFLTRKAVHINNIMEKEYPFIKDLVTKRLISKFREENGIKRQYNRQGDNLRKVSPLLNEVVTKINYNYRYESISSNYLNEIVDIAQKNGWYNREVNLVKHYNDFMDGIKLFKYVELEDAEAVELSREYLKEKGKIITTNKKLKK